MIDKVNGSDPATQYLELSQVYSLLYRLQQLNEKDMKPQLDVFLRKEVTNLLGEIKDRGLLPIVSRGIEDAVEKDLAAIKQAIDSGN
jgi:hypothetical protein